MIYSLRLFFQIIVLCFMLLLVGCATATTTTMAPNNNAIQPQVDNFIQQMISQYQFDPVALKQIFAQVEINPEIIQLITKPHETKPWFVYRGIFMTPERVQAGVAFWHQHAATLAYAEKQYGVPAEVIVAILGVETYYGRNTGNFNALDALTTLSFAYPPREQFFQTELKQYFLLTRELGIDPTHLKSSYAGALGFPQFMPSSYRQYAVSYQNSGYSNLFNNADDAIVSIANYFHHFGWQMGQPVTVRVQSQHGEYISLNSQGIKSAHSVEEWHHQGFYSQQILPAASQVQVVALLDEHNSREYWFAMHNFDVIMHYNTSPLYAMAVYQLSQQLKAYYNRFL